MKTLGVLISPPDTTSSQFYKLKQILDRPLRLIPPAAKPSHS